MRNFPLFFSMTVGALIVSAPVIIFGEETNPVDIPVKNLIPASGAIEGWTLVEGPVMYSPDTLFELVDGAAPFYLQLGFRELAHARYQRADDKSFVVTLDVYDQGTVEGGFGVYSSSRHPTESFQKWGTQGYRSGSLTILWKERFYVSLMGDDEHPQTIRGLESFAGWIGARIPGQDVYPDLLQQLPSKDRLSNTEQYTAVNYLGYRFLENVMSAQYRVESSTAILFVADYTASEKAKTSYAQAAEEIGKKESAPDASSIPLSIDACVCVDKYLGHVVLLRIERYLYGVYDSENKLPARQLWTAIEPVLDRAVQKQKK